MTTTGSSNAASCFICLDDGVDESGSPPRRDCSCRADNGFAHLSCLIENAKAKSMSDSIHYKHSAWSTCPSCNQMFQRDLALDLAKAQLEFVEEEHSSTHISRDVMMLGALYVKLNAIGTNGTRHNSQMRAEAKQTANKSLSLVKKLKSSGRYVDDWLHQNEAHALANLGLLCFQDGSDAGYNMSIVYFAKARDVSKRMGDELRVKELEVVISDAEGRLGVRNSCLSGDQLDSWREIYSKCEKKSKGSLDVLRAGMAFSTELWICHRGIEAERLMTKLASTSRLVHGKEHTVTKKMEECLASSAKKRLVRKLTGGILTSHGDEALGGSKGDVYEALRYIDEGAKCIIKGPCNNLHSSDKSEVETETVDSNSIGFYLGTPVVCQCLKKASHLNGKIGDVRSFNEESQRYEVYFEDTSLVPSVANVKGENLRIVFDLPEES